MLCTHWLQINSAQTALRSKELCVLWSECKVKCISEVDISWVTEHSLLWLALEDLQIEKTTSFTISVIIDNVITLKRYDLIADKDWFQTAKNRYCQFQIWFSSSLMISIFVHGVNPEETGSANRSNIQISKPVSCHGAKRKETQHHNYQNIVQVFRMCQWMRTDGSLLPKRRCRLLLFACDENILLLHWT